MDEACRTLVKKFMKSVVVKPEGKDTCGRLAHRLDGNIARLNISSKISTETVVSIPAG
jgi:hypothetical protein